MTAGVGALLDVARAALESVRLPSGGYRALNEAETRAHLIDPIVAALGFVTLDQVRREFKLEASGQFVDYLLAVGDVRIVVEAKPLGSDLAPKDASQLVGYCAQEGVRWALLSNGVAWHIFDIEVKGNWQAKRVAEVDLWAADRNGDLGQNVTVLWSFARESLIGGDQGLQAWARAERARTLLEGLLRNPASPVVQAVMKEMAAMGIELEPSEAVELLRSGSVARPREGHEPSARAVGPVPKLADAPTQHFLIFPAGAEAGHKAEQFLNTWLGSGIWGVRKQTPHRARISDGDRCCFYLPRVGVVAHAVIAGPADEKVTPEKWPGPNAYSDDVFLVPLRDIEWIPKPWFSTRAFGRHYTRSPERIQPSLGHGWSRRPIRSVNMTSDC